MQCSPIRKMLLLEISLWKMLRMVYIPWTSLKCQIWSMWDLECTAEVRVTTLFDRNSWPLHTFFEAWKLFVYLLMWWAGNCSITESLPEPFKKDRQDLAGAPPQEAWLYIVGRSDDSTLGPGPMYVIRAHICLLRFPMYILWAGSAVFKTRAQQVMFGPIIRPNL